jgi:hypothetical protein
MNPEKTIAFIQQRCDLSPYGGAVLQAIQLMFFCLLLFFIKSVGNKLSFASKDVSSCTFTELRGISHF